MTASVIGAYHQMSFLPIRTPFPPFSTPGTKQPGTLLLCAGTSGLLLTLLIVGEVENLAVFSSILTRRMLLNAKMLIQPLPPSGAGCF